MKLNFLSSKTDYVKVEDKNRFYYMLQQMQANRWRITAIVLGIFILIILGINAGVFLGSKIGEDWKEMFFMNHAQRVIGPKVPDGQKASILLRKWFNDNKNSEWYKKIDNWLDGIIRNEMQTVNTDKYDGVFLEKYVEDNFNGF